MSNGSAPTQHWKKSRATVPDSLHVTGAHGTVTQRHRADQRPGKRHCQRPSNHLSWLHYPRIALYYFYQLDVRLHVNLVTLNIWPDGITTRFLCCLYIQQRLLKRKWFPLQLAYLLTLCCHCADTRLRRNVFFHSGLAWYVFVKVKPYKKGVIEGGEIRRW